MMAWIRGQQGGGRKMHKKYAEESLALVHSLSPRKNLSDIASLKAALMASKHVSSDSFQP